MLSFGGSFSPIKLSKDARPQAGINLAEAAQSAARRDGGPRLRAVGAIYESAARSATADASGMEQAISRAHRAYESSRGHDPDWVYLPEAALSGMTGWAYMQLGDHQKAAPHLQAAVDGTVAWPRENAGWRIKMAENYIQGGEIAEGCQRLVDHFEQIGGMSSTRLRSTLDAVAVDVRPHATVPEAREFLGLLATV